MTLYWIASLAELTPKEDKQKQRVWYKDYASKIISKWRAANREKINIHYPKRKCKQKKSAYQKLLERNKGARGIRRIKMDLEDIHGKIMNRKKISRIMKELNLRTKK